jgi:Tol biopolymer transport system component
MNTPALHVPCIRVLFFVPIVVALLLAPLAAAESARPGGERQIYRDPETGRTVWRMTASKTNDKHCYYSEQPWSPDMKHILFSVGLPTDQSKVGSIWVMDADGSNFRKLADPVPYNMHTGANPVWSPDGKQVYWGGSGACDLQGRPVVRPNEDEYLRSKDEYRKGPVHITNAMCYALSPHKKLLDEKPAAVRNPKWSPDGKTFMLGFSNEFEDPVTYKMTMPTVKELYLIDADGKNFRRLGDYGHHHSWVPDSRHVIFAGQNDEGLVYQAIDGSSRRVVSKVTGTHASVNPQLTHAVTDVYHDRTGPYLDYLVLIDLKDGRVEKLVKTPRTHARTHGWTHPNPSWSPDGSMVMYDSDESGVCQVYAVVVDEKKVRQRFGDGAIAPAPKS